jgi:hypothetical protein
MMTEDQQNKIAGSVIATVFAFIFAVCVIASFLSK